MPSSDVGELVLDKARRRRELVRGIKRVKELALDLLTDMAPCSRTIPLPDHLAEAWERFKAHRLANSSLRAWAAALRSPFAGVTSNSAVLAGQMTTGG